MNKVQSARPKVAVIETGVKRPVVTRTTSRGEPISLCASMRELKVDQSILLDEVIFRRRATATASHLKMKVRTNKTEDGHLLVTRVA